MGYARAVKTALMIGATGLVGSQLLIQLLDDQRFGKVIAFGRRQTGRAHPKLEEQVIDFDAPESWSSLVRGDVAFSSLGTTQKQAGSQAAQMLRLIEALEEHDDVQKVSANFDIDEKEMQAVMAAQ